MPRRGSPMKFIAKLLSSPKRASTTSESIQTVSGFRTHTHVHQWERQAHGKRTFARLCVGLCKGRRPGRHCYFHVCTAHVHNISSFLFHLVCEFRIGSISERQEMKLATSKCKQKSDYFRRSVFDQFSSILRCAKLIN